MSRLWTGEPPFPPPELTVERAAGVEVSVVLVRLGAFFSEGAGEPPLPPPERTVLADEPPLLPPLRTVGRAAGVEVSVLLARLGAAGVHPVFLAAGALPGVLARLLAEADLVLLARTEDGLGLLILVMGIFSDRGGAL